MTDKDRIEILAVALREAIAALELLMGDPANRSEVTPDVHRLRATLPYVGVEEAP